MSIFDKFNVNPYISTYAGAPIDAFNKVASTLQQRMNVNLAKKNELELKMDEIKSMNIDEDFKRRKIAEYEQGLQEIADNPEYATAKVSELAKNVAMDEDLKLMIANRQQQAAIEKKIEENDYSDFQTYRYQQQLKKYNTPDEKGRVGAEKGAKFTDVNFYEEVDLDKLVDERGKGIASYKSGDYEVTEDGTLIEKYTREVIDPEKIQSAVMGVYNNAKNRRQIEDEYAHYLRNTSEEEPRYQSSKEYFLGQYASPAVDKYQKDNFIRSASAMPKGSGSGGFKSLGANVLYEGPSVASNMLESIESSEDFQVAAAGLVQKLKPGSGEDWTLQDEQMLGRMDQAYQMSLASPDNGMSAANRDIMQQHFGDIESMQKWSKLVGSADKVEAQLSHARTQAALGLMGQDAVTQLEQQRQAIVDAEMELLDANGINMTAEEFKLFEKQTSRFFNESMWSKDLGNYLKNEEAAQALTTNYMTLPSKVSKQLSPAVQTVMSGMIKSNDGKRMLVQGEDKKLKPFEEGVLDGYDLSKAKVQSLGSRNTGGMIQVFVPNIENEEEGKIVHLSVPDSYSTLNTDIANAFMEESVKPANAKFRGRYKDVADNFGMNAMIQDIQVNMSQSGARKVPIASSGPNSTDYGIGRALEVPGGSTYIVYDEATSTYSVEDSAGNPVKWNGKQATGFPGVDRALNAVRHWANQADQEAAREAANQD
jgi:hypothetical protein